ncbi:hypothetical protein ACWDA9_32540 [Streptomyces sp. NPDC001193]
MLIRAHRVARRLDRPTTLPVGLAGDQPQVSAVESKPGDRFFCFTHGPREPWSALSNA